MSRTSLVSSSAIGFMSLLSAAPMVQPATADLLPGNVRPFFSAGPSIPVDFGGASRGFGVGFGFEAEQSPRVSVLFRVEWHLMRGMADPPRYPFDSYSTSDELTTANWSLGARAYLGTHGPVRSFVDGGLGVRLVADGRPGSDGGIVPLSPAGLGSASGPIGASAEREGLTIILRFGLSSVAPGRPGFFLDSGVDLLLDNPDRYGLVPVRLGVAFP